MRLGEIDLIEVGKQVVKQSLRDDVPGMAAELAYRFFLALFPFFIFLTALSGYMAAILGIDDPTIPIIEALGEALPPGAAELIHQELEQIVGTQNPGLLSIGAVAAILVATGGVNAVIKVMNRAYRVEESRPFWKRYPLAFGLTLLASVLIVGAFFVFLMGQFMAVALGLGGILEIVLTVARWPVAFILVLLATMFLFWAAPNLSLPFKLIMPGAIIFAAGWLIATFVFSMYVTEFAEYGATYGALAGVAILLVWFYIVSFVLLVAAEVNDVLDEMLDPERIERGRERAHEERERQEREKRRSE